jgi:hypothetical protein
MEKTEDQPERQVCVIEYDKEDGRLKSKHNEQTIKTTIQTAIDLIRNTVIEMNEMK